MNRWNMRSPGPESARRRAIASEIFGPEARRDAAGIDGPIRVRLEHCQEALKPGEGLGRGRGVDDAEESFLLHGLAEVLGALKIERLQAVHRARQVDLQRGDVVVEQGEEVRRDIGGRLEKAAMSRLVQRDPQAGFAPVEPVGVGERVDRRDDDVDGALLGHRHRHVVGAQSRFPPACRARRRLGCP